MKKLLLIISLFPLTIFGQQKTTGSKINIGLFITPEFTCLTNNSANVQQELTSEFGISTGLILKIKLSNKLFIRTGFGYGYKNYSNMQTGLIFGSDIDPVKGFISESKFETKINFKELQLPFSIQYDLKKQLFIAGGIEFLYLFENNTEKILYYGNGTKETRTNNYFEQFNLAPTLSIGYNIPISDKFNVSIEPMFKYYLIEYIINESHLFNFGLRITVNFGL